MCQIIYETTSISPAPGGQTIHPDAMMTVGTARCAEHNMPMAGVVGPDDLCPIGKIEAATDKALARIKGAIPPTQLPHFVLKD